MLITFPYQFVACWSALKTSEIINDGAKLNRKSEKLTPFGCVFLMMLIFGLQGDGPKMCAYLMIASAADG